MSSAKAAAAGYRRGGWCPIPIKKRSKQTALGQLAPYLKRPATQEELGAKPRHGSTTYICTPAGGKYADLEQTSLSSLMASE